MTREELIHLVNEIVNGSNKPEEELNQLVKLLEENVPHPAPTDLIYFDELTPEEIVDRALNYKPITLPGNNNNPKEGKSS